jgi:hypothetical protein
MVSSIGRGKTKIYEACSVSRDETWQWLKFDRRVNVRIYSRCGFECLAFFPGVAEVAPGRGQDATGKLPAGDLAGLAEIAEREGAEVAAVTGEPADGVVLEGLRPRPLHRALAETTELVIGRGDGAVGERALLLLHLQGAQRADGRVAELRGADAVGARDQAREENVPREADVGRGVDGAGIGDAQKPVVPGVAVGLDLACRVGDGLQPAGLSPP